MYKQAAHSTFSHRLPFQISGLHEKTQRGKAKIKKKQNPLKKNNPPPQNPFYYARHEVKSLQYSIPFKQWKKVIHTEP